MQKKADFKSTAVNHLAFSGICVNKVYGFGTRGWMGTTTSFTRQRSCTNLHSLLGFWTPKIGVLHGLLYGTRRPWDFRLVITSPQSLATLRPQGVPASG